jgi:hypothetical protein
MACLLVACSTDAVAVSNHAPIVREPQDELGTLRTPVRVQVVPTAPSSAEIEQQQRDREAREKGDAATALTNQRLILIGCAQLVVFALQLGVFGYQARKLRETVDAAGDQAAEMRHSVAEAARLASAMERMALNGEQSVQALRERTAQQMRAYLTIVIGGGTYQEREKGLKFDVRPNLVNTGNTPAHKVGYRARADILPVPLPADFALVLSEGRSGSSVVGPHHNMELGAVVDRFVPDSEVEDIKRGIRRAVYVWGTVWYEDVFGEARETHFCHHIIWRPDGKVYGYYNERNNTAT